MWISIDEIEDFYTTESGYRFKNSITRIIEKYNDNTTQILSVGYTQEHNIPTIIPAKQGLVKGTIIAHENMLPVANNSIDTILVIHTLEYTANLKSLFKEVLRVLKSYGNAIFIFPNLYANLVICHHIFKHSKCEAYVKRLLKQNGFVINKIKHLSPFTQPFSSTVKDIISVINTQKKIHGTIPNINKNEITAKT